MTKYIYNFFKLLFFKIIPIKTLLIMQAKRTIPPTIFHRIARTPILIDELYARPHCISS
jgi:hypothetical protein